MIRRILVPMDGSSAAETVLPHVGALGRAFGSRIELLHVLPVAARRYGRASSDPLTARIARADRTHYLEAVARRLRAQGLDATFRLQEAAPAEVIVEILRAGAYDAVGLTAHGAGDDPHLPMGCTAAAIVLNAPTSILLVPSRKTGAEGTTIEPIRYRRVIAPVDCSPRSDWSLSAAAAVACGSGATLKLVHILDSPALVSRLPCSGRGAELLDQIKELNRAEATRYIREAAWRLGSNGIRVEGEVLDAKRAPAAAIRDLLAFGDRELAVLSAHGRGGSTDWPLGGTAAKLMLWTGGCPVLLLQDLRRTRTLSEVPRRSERVSVPSRAHGVMERRVGLRL